MDNIGKRVQELILALGFNAVQFAESIEEDPSKISSYKRGKYKPGINVIAKILSKYKNLNPEWFFYGTGLMFKEENSIIATADQSNQYNVKKPPERPPCDDGEKILLTKDEQVSMLIMQNDKLINIVEKHTNTIVNLTTPTAVQFPVPEMKVGGNVPKNVKG